VVPVRPFLINGLASLLIAWDTLAAGDDRLSEEFLMKIAGMLVLLLGVSSFAFAGGIAAPEISAASGVAAITLVSGALLVMRGRRQK
jgi:hypothetical protein